MLQGSLHYYPERALQMKGVHVRGVQGCTHDQPGDWAYEIVAKLALFYSPHSRGDKAGKVAKATGQVRR